MVCDQGLNGQQPQWWMMGSRRSNTSKCFGNYCTAWTICLYRMGLLFLFHSRRWLRLFTAPNSNTTFIAGGTSPTAAESMHAIVDSQNVSSRRKLINNYMCYHFLFTIIFAQYSANSQNTTLTIFFEASILLVTVVCVLSIFFNRCHHHWLGAVVIQKWTRLKTNTQWMTRLSHTTCCYSTQT